MNNTLKIVILFFTVLSYSSYGQDQISLTVDGKGKTQEAAKLDAFRNAIEQAFGTFVSSNTQILNDELIKDEIISLSSGNINDFKIISELQLPNKDWTLTMLVHVSIKNLTTFTENKGFEAEFKGSLFAGNLKLEKLKSENELSVIKNTIRSSIEMANIGFDYSIDSSNPQLAGKWAEDNNMVFLRVMDNKRSLNKPCNGECYTIPITITVKMNDNFTKMLNHLRTTIDAIKMTESEIKFHQQGNIPFITFKAIISKSSKMKRSTNSSETHSFSLRNQGSVIFLNVFLSQYLSSRILACEVSNGLEKVSVFEVQKNYNNYLYSYNKQMSNTNFVFTDNNFLTNYNLIGSSVKGTNTDALRNSDNNSWIFDFRTESPKYSEKELFNFEQGSGTSYGNLTLGDYEFPVYYDYINPFLNFNNPTGYINFAFNTDEAFFKYELVNVETIDNVSKISRYTIKPIIN